MYVSLNTTLFCIIVLLIVLACFLLCGSSGWMICVGLFGQVRSDETGRQKEKSKFNRTSYTILDFSFLKLFFKYILKTDELFS